MTPAVAGVGRAPSIEEQSRAVRQRRHEATEAALLAHLAAARRLGVCDLDACSEEGGASTLRRAATLRKLATMDVAKFGTALGWVELYTAEHGELALRRLAHAADVAAAAHNSGVYDGVAEYIRKAGSRAKGREGDTVRGDTIQEYVAALRIAREICTGEPVVIKDITAGAARLYKAMRKEDGAPGARETRRALRAGHLRKLESLRYDRSSSEAARTEWEMALTGHSLLLRGGEVGRIEGQEHEFDPARGLVWWAIEWRAPHAASRERPWAIVWVMAIKDQSGKNRRQPILIVRKHSGPPGADALCVYDALVARWERLVGALPRDAAGHVAGRMPDAHPLAGAPVFAHADGAAYDTGDVRRTVKRMATACGEDASRFGAKSLRTGGATDLRAVLGMAGKDFIAARGRWNSDIAQIYQRAMASDQLDGAASMTNAGGDDLESLITGWSQPAVTV